MTGHHDLDHASTTPLRPAARVALLAALDAGFGDPSRIHQSGMAARVALEEAREVVATFLGARPREVVFTSGATESIAAASFGAAQRGVHQVVSAVEHSAVRGSAEAASAARGGEVRTVAVDGDGVVDPDEFVAALDADTGVAHLQWVNHEVGVVQPVVEVAARCRAAKTMLHVDAAQAGGRLPIDFVESGIDLLSISGHKLGAPAGIGALLVRRGLRIDPLLVGGDQERARRGGLENVAGACALAAAVDAIDLEGETDRQTDLRRQLETTVTEVDGVVVYGAGAKRAPHLACVGIEDIEPQAVLLGLDRAGIRAHSGSACASEGLEPSPVLEAMGVDAHRSLRLSVGWTTTERDIAALGLVFADVVDRLRALRP